MAKHVRSWSDADRERVRSRLADAAGRLPGVTTTETNGHTSYFVRGKRFGYFLVDHHGDDRLALAVKAPAGEQETLVAADSVRYFVPAYVGSRGWVGANLDDASNPDWSEVVGLLEQAWRMTAGARVVAAYDAGHADLD